MNVLTRTDPRSGVFAALGANWAGEDTITPSPEIVGDAIRLLQDTPAGPEPIAVPGDGEIEPAWFNGPDRLIAIIAADRHLTWVIKRNGAIRPGGTIDLASDSFEAFYRAMAAFSG